MQTKEEVHEFEKLEQQLHAFLSEISELSKKKPNDGLNKFKLKFINTMMEGLNKLIGEDRPFADFEIFDVDSIPTNSDVVIILAQYAVSIYEFRRENTVYDTGHWYWIVRGRHSDIKTERPENYRYRSR